MSEMMALSHGAARQGEPAGAGAATENVMETAQFKRLELGLGLGCTFIDLCTFRMMVKGFRVRLGLGVRDDMA